MIREALRHLPWRFRHWLRYSTVGYYLHAERWMP
jgi:hypothetical protein